VWGTPTDEEPAYAFRHGGIDIIVAQGVSLYLRPQFMILGRAVSARHLRGVEQFMPLGLASRDQVVAWVTYAVGVDFSPACPVGWFEEGLGLQGLLPWVEGRRRMLAKAEENAQLRKLRPHCFVERHAMREMLKSAVRTVGWPPAPGRFEISFEGQVLRLYARGRLACAPAEGADWQDRYSGDLAHLNALPSRLLTNPVEVGIWRDHLEIERVRILASAVAAP
jgi:hypothetical protein